MPIQFIRKNTKVLMAFFGVLLMISFVMVPGSNRGGGRSGGEIVRGRMAGKKITADDLAWAQSEEQVFRLLAGNSALSLSYRPDPAQPHLQYYLLCQEALKQGFIATEDEVNGFLRQLGFQSEEQFDQVLRDQLRMQSDPRTNRLIFRRALKNLILLEKSLMSVQSSVLMSLPEQEYWADQLWSRVQCHYLEMKAATVAGHQGEPTAQAIEKQFQTYRSASAGEGSQFGYRFADRVELEYLKIDRAALVRDLGETPEDLVESYRYYKAHLEEFTTPPTTQPTTAPGPKTFEQVKAELVGRRVNRRVEDRLARILSRVEQLLEKPLSERDERGFFRVPERSKWVSMEKVAQEIQKEFGVRPHYLAAAGWLDAAGLAALPELGLAANESMRGERFAALAMQVKELKETATGRTLSAHLQVGVPGPVLTDVGAPGAAGSGAVFVYRICAAQKSHEPATVAEVKEAVVRDLKLQMAYEALKLQGQSLLKNAREKGLSHASSSWKLQETPEFSQKQPNADWMSYQYQRRLEPPVTAPIGALGTLPEVTQAVFAAAKAEKTPGHSVVQVNLPGRLEVLLLEVAQYKPVTRGQLESQRMMLRPSVEMPRQVQFMQEWIGLQQVAQRMDYQPEGGWESLKKETAEAP